jgi:hypothetical protein
MDPTAPLSPGPTITLNLKNPQMIIDPLHQEELKLPYPAISPNFHMALVVENMHSKLII